jgi:hypothetical protein
LVVGRFVVRFFVALGFALATAAGFVDRLVDPLSTKANRLGMVVLGRFVVGVVVVGAAVVDHSIGASVVVVVGGAVVVVVVLVVVVVSGCT